MSKWGTAFIETEIILSAQEALQIENYVEETTYIKELLNEISEVQLARLINACNMLRDLIRAEMDYRQYKKKHEVD